VGAVAVRTGATVEERVHSDRPARETTALVVAIGGGGVIVDGPDLFGLTGPEPGVAAYDLSIDTADAQLPIIASSRAGAVRLSVVTAVLDIVT